MATPCDVHCTLDFKLISVVHRSTGGATCFMCKLGKVTCY